MEWRVSTTLLVIAGLLTAGEVALAHPRLLMSYPKDGAVYGNAGSLANGPITFVFSEPMDPAAVVLPNATNTNPGRSLDVVGFLGTVGMPVTTWPFPIALQPRDLGTVTTREAGRLVEIPGSRIIGQPPFSAVLHLYHTGFRSLSGESLDRDYTLTYHFCDGCILTSDDLLCASVPPDGAAGTDPNAPLSIYFGVGVDAPTFGAALTGGAGVPGTTPLAYNWDTMDTRRPLRFGFQSGGFLHLSVAHQPLAASPRPYVFGAPKAVTPTVPLLREDRGLVLSFTVGPALAGDLNGDGQVTVADVVLALRAALGFLTLTATQTFAADLVPRTGANGHPIGDGNVTVADATYILQRAIGLVADDQWP